MTESQLFNALRYWWHQLPALSVVGIPMLVIMAAVTLSMPLDLPAESQTPAIRWDKLLLSGLIYTVFEGAVIGQLLALHHGHMRGPGALLTFSVLLLPGLLIINLVTYVLLVIGLALFVLPGVWIFARLALAPMVMAAEQTGVVAAIQTSFQRSRPFQLNIMADVLLLMLAYIGVIGLVVSAAGEQPGNVALLGLTILELLVALVLEVLVFHYYLRSWPKSPPDSSPDYH